MRSENGKGRLIPEKVVVRTDGAPAPFLANLDNFATINEVY